MITLRVFVIVSTVAIYAMTLIASINEGINWPEVAIEDLIALNWRSQFNIDFIIYLLLGSVWISWREAFTLKGHFFGFLNIFLGGMFSFPYLLLATYQTKVSPKLILLGVHAAKGNTSPINDG